MTVRWGAALLVLFGCVIGDEGLVLFVCLTFVCLVRGVLGRGEEGAGVVDIGVVVRFWNKRADVAGSVSVSEALPALHWVGTVGRLVLSFLWAISAVSSRFAQNVLLFSVVDRRLERPHLNKLGERITWD